MAIEIRKASRKRAKMRLGLCAPAGSGKTMGALLVAYGLTGDWSKIGLADTENGSGELYVGHTVPGTNFVIGEFLYAGIRAPFSVSKYMEAHAGLVDAGCEVVILDSISHAWAGSGGLLDKQGHIAAKSGNSYTAWRDVTPEHNAFIEMMLQSPAHIIATLRSKVEYVLETNDKGRQAPRKVGMAPVQREGLDFEFSVVFDIDQNHMASSSKDRTSLFDGEYFKLMPDVGKKMLDWLNTGADAPAPKSPDDELLDRIVSALEAAPDAEKVRKIRMHHEAQHLRDRLRNGKLERLNAAIDAAEKRTAPEPEPASATPVVDNYEWPDAATDKQEAA